MATTNQMAGISMIRSKGNAAMKPASYVRFLRRTGRMTHQEVYELADPRTCEPTGKFVVCSIRSIDIHGNEETPVIVRAATKAEIA